MSEGERFGKAAGRGASESESDQEDRVVRSLRMTAELDDRVSESARHLGLRKSEVQRLAIERGLDVLLEQLGKKETA